MPHITKYEALTGEEPKTALLGNTYGSNNGKGKDGGKQGQYSQLSLGAANVDDEQDWDDSIRTADSSDLDDDHPEQFTRQHTHFVHLLGRRFSFLVSCRSFSCNLICLAPAMFILVACSKSAQAASHTI